MSISSWSERVGGRGVVAHIYSLNGLLEVLWRLWSLHGAAASQSLVGL